MAQAMFMVKVPPERVRVGDSKFGYVNCMLDKVYLGWKNKYCHKILIRDC